MYDRHGNVKYELDDQGAPTETKRSALGGEPNRDEYGERRWQYVKSEGGEPMYDQDGNRKTREVENPDYEPPPDQSDSGNVTLRTKQGDMELQGYDNGDTYSVYASDAGGGGDIAYATLLADAVRNDKNVTGGSLSRINQIRILSNSLSNYARTGKNPRSQRGTLSGDAPRADAKDRYAEGPEIWRAEAEEAKERIKAKGGNPDRVYFDGEQFYIDGEPADPKDIAKRIVELSPGVDAPSIHNRTGVGEKTVKRMAIFDWLRRASPEEAKAAATGWNKGNIFTGIGAGAVGLSSLLREDNQPDDAATQ